MADIEDKSFSTKHLPHTSSSLAIVILVCYFQARGWKEQATNGLHLSIFLSKIVFPPLSLPPSWSGHTRPWCYIHSSHSCMYHVHHFLYQEYTPRFLWPVVMAQYPIALPWSSCAVTLEILDGYSADSVEHFTRILLGVSKKYGVAN